MARRLDLTRARRRAGFSLVELTVSMAVMTVVLLSVTDLGTKAQSALDTSTSHMKRDLDAQRGLELVVEALTSAASATFGPDPADAFGTDDLTFNTLADMEGGVATWSNTHRLAVRLEAAELDNGLDDDGDGLIDERELVLTLDEGQPEQRERVLVRGVAELGEGEVANFEDDDGDGVIDEPGFCLRREGELLFIQLTLQGRTGDEPLFTVSSETRTALRN